MNENNVCLVLKRWEVDGLRLAKQRGIARSAIKPTHNICDVGTIRLQEEQLTYKALRNILAKY